MITQVARPRHRRKSAKAKAKLTPQQKAEAAQEIFPGTTAPLLPPPPSLKAFPFPLLSLAPALSFACRTSASKLLPWR
eukprot:COSAG06_NODE_4690_length_4034_cov_220.520457_3_plen_78_part_00